MSEIDVVYTNGECLKLRPVGMTLPDITDRVQRGIRRVMNSEV